MFVSEIIPGLWVCDYDVINSPYFKNRNIKLFIHIYTYYDHNQPRLYLNYDQDDKEIKVNNIILNSNNISIKHQNSHIADGFGKNILHYLDTIHEILENMEGVVIYSEYGIQKAATVACSYLIGMGDFKTDTAIKIMLSKEPLFFKDPKSIYKEDHIILYRETLKYIEYNY
jgi:hypothetical protein